MDLILGSQSPRRRELLERMGLEFRVLTAEIDETKYETEDPEASVRRICRAKAEAVAERLMQENSQFSVFNSQLVLTADTIVVLDGKILGKPHDEAEARAMLRALSGREHAVYTAFTLLPGQATGNGQQAIGDRPACRGGSYPQGEPPARSGQAAGSRQQATGDGGTDCRDQSAVWSRNDKAENTSPAVTCHLSPVPCPLSPAASTAFTHCEKTYVKFRTLTEAEIAAYVATGEPMDKAGAYGIQGLGAMLVEAIHGDYFTVMGLPVCRLAVALKRYGIDPLAP